MKPNKQNRLKRTSQIWRPSEILADAGPLIWFSRIYLEINMQPKLCGPSWEAQRTSLFKPYLPNLTAFRISSRRWTTHLVFKDSLEIDMLSKLYKPPHEAQQTKPSKTYLPNLTAFRNSSRRWTTDLIFKDLPKIAMPPEPCAPRKAPNEQVV